MEKIHRGNGFHIVETEDKIIMSFMTGELVDRTVSYEISRENMIKALNSDKDAREVMRSIDTGRRPPKEDNVNKKRRFKVTPYVLVVALSGIVGSIIKEENKAPTYEITQEQADNLEYEHAKKLQSVLQTELSNVTENYTLVVEDGERLLTLEDVNKNVIFEGISDIYTTSSNLIGVISTPNYIFNVDSGETIGTYQTLYEVEVYNKEIKRHLPGFLYKENLDSDWQLRIENTIYDNITIYKDPLTGSRDFEITDDEVIQIQE